jgi:TatD DNase family protein
MLPEMRHVHGIIDTHCHLNHEKFAPGDTPAALVARAQAAGVGGMLTICCKISEDLVPILDIAVPYPNVWCTIGTHPHESGLPEEKAYSAQDIAASAQANKKIIGIGETGLDYYYNYSSREDQQASFRKHIQAAVIAGLPLIIHARDADDDLIRIMKEEGAGANPRVRGVMHCFSGTPWLAEQALALGFYISFSGILTFRKSDELRAIARTVPLDRMMVETDSPYLAPEPVRGKVNEPAYVLHTLRTLAEIKSLDERGALEHCNQNFFRLFNRVDLA